MRSNETILVTGGAGFIGGSFIELLLNGNHQGPVVCFDKLTYAGQPDRVNIHKNSKGYTFVKGDIADPVAVKKLLQDYKPACIVNFAAESHVDNSLVDDSVFYRTNVTGVQTLLYQAVEQNVKNFVQVSTDEVYGQRLNGPAFSEKSPYAPRNPYAVTKVRAEELVRAYQKQGKIRTLITRGCNTFGPWQHGEKLISKTVLKALSNEKIPIYGNGLQKREWIYSFEHARAIYHLIENDCFGEVFNIGSGYETTNIKIVEQILNILGKPMGLIEYVEDRKNHDFQYGVAREKLIHTGFTINQDMSRDLIRTVNFYKKLMKNKTFKTPSV